MKKSKNELRNKISRSHARCIQKAINQGLIFNEVNDLEYLKIFYKFYKNVMDKNEVVPHKFSYFIKMFSHLKNNLHLVCVKYRTTVIGVSIVLRSSANVLMLYGGMSEAGYERYAKHFMIDRLIFEYKEKGYKRLVLGTGHNGKDSIYRFKKGFTDQNSYIDTYSIVL
ncbi:MAG: GNAT family N-acetyltransferase [Candidatus Omnitrophica bacterium]|nr:GNAT family N-acetyltransferase [Candidatus Omnitrophota bacterium]